MHFEAPIAKFWLLRRRVSQSLARIPKPVSTGVENAQSIDLIRKLELVQEARYKVCPGSTIHL